MSERPVRIALWCAVSTPQQAQVEKDSLPSQHRDGEAWAEAIGGEVVQVFEVPGHTRKYLFFQEAAQEMAVYAELLDACQRRTFDVLWCRNRDRLGRTLALIAQVDGVVREIGQAEVYSAAMPHAIGQQSGRGATLQAAVEGWMAEADNAERKAKHDMGMKGRVRRGLMANRPPLGYARNGDGYEFSEQIGAVKEMTSLFLSGHSYSEIWRRLAAGPFRPPTGGYWSYNVVYRTLHNSTYAGYPYWAGVQCQEATTHYPVLWDADTYAAILQEQQRRGRAPCGRRESGPYRGVVFCVRCGKRLSRSQRPDRGYNFLRCSQHMIHSRTGLPCHPNTVREEQVTEALAAYLAELSTPETIDDALAAMPEVRTGELQAEWQARQRQVADLQQQRQRLAFALARGDLDSALYRLTDDNLLARLEAAQAQSAGLQRQLEAVPDLDARRQVLERLAADFPALVQLAEAAEVARILQSAGLKVWCENGQVVRIELGA